MMRVLTTSIAAAFFLSVCGGLSAQAVTSGTASTTGTTAAVDSYDRYMQVPLEKNEKFVIKELPDKVRIGIHTDSKPGKVNQLVLFLLPNGNTIEESFGRTPNEKLAMRYKIQQIGAQTRRVKELLPNDKITVVYVENSLRSWPQWRRETPDVNQKIRVLTEQLRKDYGPDAKMNLVAHSGGGSYIIGVLDSGEEIPDFIERIAYLDANYSFDAETSHGVKLLNWVRGDVKRRLEVLAYDDREITLNGKKVVSETGGTWRATDRMARDFERLDYPFASYPKPDTGETSVTLGGRIKLVRMTNPELKIYHTVLVERNGFVWAVTDGRNADLKPEDALWVEKPKYMDNLLPK